MQTSGLHHVVLTITQVERSRTFYRDLLGFETTDMAGEDFSGFYFFTGGVAIFMINSTQTIADDRFSEFRVGLDHLSFTAPDQDALHSLAEKLRAADVNTKGVEQFVTGNWYVAFRDPDNIQLEYWLP